MREVSKIWKARFTRLETVGLNQAMRMPINNLITHD